MAGASERTEDRSQDKLERTMKIVIINGQSHTGTTCHIARQLAEKIGGDVTEFFLPRDFHDYCIGCMQCILKDEKRCPHYETLRPITEAMDAADVIILASPVYVYHVTGAMKTFLDHYGYRWLIHRPVESMFGKQAVSISTSAAAGEKSACRDMADSLFFWGVGKTYRLGMHVFAHNWAGVSEKRKQAIDQKTTRIAEKIRSRKGHVKPSLKMKLYFCFVRLLQKKGISEVDKSYWTQKGWLGSARPWKS